MKHLLCKFHQWLCDCHIHGLFSAGGPPLPQWAWHHWLPFLTHAFYGLHISADEFFSSLWHCCRLFCRNFSILILIGYIWFCLSIYFPCLCFLTWPSMIAWNSGKCRWFSNLFSQPRPLGLQTYILICLGETPCKCFIAPHICSARCGVCSSFWIPCPWWLSQTQSDTSSEIQELSLILPLTYTPL